VPTTYIPAQDVDEVLITGVLHARLPRRAEQAAEAAAYERIAATLAASSDASLQSLVECGVSLCQAGTCGLSVLQRGEDGIPIFRWTHMAGAYAGYVGGTTPRDFSPCGTTLDRRSPQLFSYPGRLFTYFQAVEPAIVEGLVLPVQFDGSALGTLWVVSHDEERKFDAEDVRIMSALAYFTVAALRLQTVTRLSGSSAAD
jgi:GAF domain-containing protein